MDATIIFSSIIGVFGLIGMGAYSRRLYESERKMNRLNREINDLEHAKQLTVEEAMAQAKEQASQSETGRATMQDNNLPTVIDGDKEMMLPTHQDIVNLFS